MKAKTPKVSGKKSVKTGGYTTGKTTMKGKGKAKSPNNAKVYKQQP